jgi:hypothetical protein
MALEDPDGPVDHWLNDIVIPPLDKSGAHKVALISLVFGSQPVWIDYFSKSITFSATKGIAYSYNMVHH